MDCNNKKGTKTVIDPVRKDPRSYITFDLTTGAPQSIAVKRAKSAAKATCDMLNNQTLNEARRAVRKKMVDILTRVSIGDTVARKELAKLLERATPHRAMLRELILEVDETLNPYRDTVEAAVAVIPGLRMWANTPSIVIAVS